MVEIGCPALTMVTSTNPGFTSEILPERPSIVMRVARLIPTLTVVPSSCRTTTVEPLSDCTTPWTCTGGPEWEAAAAGGADFP